jgi:lipopolysaccharide export system permease protein
VLGAIGLILLIIVGLDAVGEFVEEIGDVSDTYTFGQVALYVMLTLPGRFYEFIPFAALIGCLMGLGQLASSSELVVMRAAGVSTGRLVWIAMKPALLVAVLGFLTGEYVAPLSDQIAERHRSLAQDPESLSKGGRGLWNREGDTFLHFNALDAEGVVYGVRLLQFDQGLELRSALRAARAIYRGDHWLLENVAKTDFSSWETTRTSHDQLRWDTGITPDILTIEVVAPSQLSISDLYRYSRYLTQQGLDSDDYQLALWNKLLQPAAVGALVLVAISFVFGPLREGTMGFRIFTGVLIGIVFSTSQDLLGPASLVFGFPPIYAAIIPTGICFVAGVLLLRRAG